MSNEPHVPNEYEQALRAYGLGYPGAIEEYPWGHCALKVKGKTFAFVASDKERYGITVKLPESGEAALMMPFAQPAGYGLGKSGWVDCGFRQGEAAPVELLKKWIDESYRAVAPAKLLKELEKGKAGGASQVAHAQVAAMTSEKRKKAAGTGKKHGDKLSGATKKAAGTGKGKGKLLGKVVKKVKERVRGRR